MMENKRATPLICFLFISALIIVEFVQSIPTPRDAEQNVDESTGGGSQALDDLKGKRSILVNNFYDLQISLEEIIEGYGEEFTGKEDDVQTKVIELTDMWNEIQSLSETVLKITKSLGNIETVNEEKIFEKDLKNLYSSALFDAKARNCKSADETFFKPLSKCIKIEDPSEEDPCPQSTSLYEIEGTNEGVCDCLRDQVGLIFHKNTSSCFQLNTQGPCENGEWLVLSKNEESGDLPICESIPDENCPTDGLHVFHKGGCWKLGSQGPCSNTKILTRQSDDYSTVQCSDDPSLAGHSVFDKVAGFDCPSGSHRAQNNLCKKVYKAGGRKSEDDDIEEDPEK